MKGRVLRGSPLRLLGRATDEGGARKMRSMLEALLPTTAVNPLHFSTSAAPAFLDGHAYDLRNQLSSDGRCSTPVAVRLFPTAPDPTSNSVLATGGPSAARSGLVSLTALASSVRWPFFAELYLVNALESTSRRYPLRFSLTGRNRSDDGHLRSTSRKLHSLEESPRPRNLRGNRYEAPQRHLLPPRRFRIAPRRQEEPACLPSSRPLGPRLHLLRYAMTFSSLPPPGGRCEQLTPGVTVRTRKAKGSHRDL